jgi:hypothetical protein
VQYCTGLRISENESDTRMAHDRRSLIDRTNLRVDSFYLDAGVRPRLTSSTEPLANSPASGEFIRREKARINSRLRRAQ